MISLKTFGWYNYYSAIRLNEPLIVNPFRLVHATIFLWACPQVCCVNHKVCCIFIRHTTLWWTQPGYFSEMKLAR